MNTFIFLFSFITSMYQSIGEVFLQTVGKVRVAPASQATYEHQPVNTPFPITGTGKKNIRLMEVRGYVFNDGLKSRKEYASDIDAIMGRNTAYNRILINDANGYIQPSEVEVRNTEDEMNLYLIYGKYLPASDYDEYYTYQQFSSHSVHARGLPSYFVLPYGVNSIIRSSNNDNHLNVAKTTQIVTPEANLPIFTHNDWFTYENAVYNCTFIDIDEATRFKALKFDSTEDYARWDVVTGINFFSGNNVIGINCKIINSTSENLTVTIKDANNVTVYTQTFTITNTEWEYKTTSAINFDMYTGYTITLSIGVGVGSVLVDLMRIKESGNHSYIRFHTIEPTHNKGEAKLYDTVTDAEVDKTKWKRVYNVDHTFTGNMVLENATMQWKIKQGVLWNTTGTFTDRISSETGTLRPAEFTDKTVRVKIVDIKPDAVKVIFHLAGESTMMRMDCTVTPLTVHAAVRPLVTPANAKGWVLEVPTNVAKGTLDTKMGSLVMFTTTSSISMIKTKFITPTYTTNGYCSHNGTTTESTYSFDIVVLPRVTDNTGKLFDSHPVSGTYFVDGEFIDTGKTIYLADFINSLCENGMFVEKRLAHRLYGDE